MKTDMIFPFSDRITNKKGFASHTEPNYFGETLRDIRFEKKISQKIAAKLVGVTQAQWSSYEVGKTRSGLDQVIAIANGLELDLIEFAVRIFKKREELLASKK